VTTTSGNLEEIARVRTALSEGFCPAGHKLSHGGGKWGSCGRCATLWTVTGRGYTYRHLGPIDGYWHVTEHAKFFEYSMRREGR